MMLLVAGRRHTHRNCVRLLPVAPPRRSERE
jgi:hypothetical protein